MSLHVDAYRNDYVTFRIGVGVVIRSAGNYECGPNAQKAVVCALVVPIVTWFVPVLRLTHINAK